MINTSSSDVVFNYSGEKLSGAISHALELSAETILSTLGLDAGDINLVDTKNNIRAAFPKFVFLSVLQEEARIFDESYVRVALGAYDQKGRFISKDDFITLMRPIGRGALAFKQSYACAVRPGIGLFLVALHCTGAITLSANFQWPYVRIESKRQEIGRMVSSELLAFVRSLDSQSESAQDPAFKSVSKDRSRREWFLSYGTRLLVATGWHFAEDVNVEDLMKIKRSESSISEKSIPFAYKALLAVLIEKFGERVPITLDDWSKALRDEIARNGGRKIGDVGGKLNKLLKDSTRYDIDVLTELLKVKAILGSPDRIRAIDSLPGINFDVMEQSKIWLDLEDLYIERTARESYKGIKSAINWWNVYLFLYLPYWFERYPDTTFVYPNTPGKLLKTLFVSRLMPLDCDAPRTFMEFMDAQSECRGWSGNGYYSIVLQLQKFFEFIEKFSDELPGCNGFKQPIAAHDFPRSSRSKGTSKNPVPRELFAVLLGLYESIIEYQAHITNLILDDFLSDDEVNRICQFNFIDTFAVSNIVGFVPILLVGSKIVPLQFIPNVLDVARRTLSNGRRVLLPHPHGLIQCLVALHTGLRHNHIQWLDRDKFDSLVDDEDALYTLLYVNTDKQKLKPWSPHVAKRVVELLRSQRAWVELIGEDGFHSIHFYNNNPSTKWPKFRPLFAKTKNGLPHDDSVYFEAWRQMLCVLQRLSININGRSAIRPLFRLLPPNLKIDDPELEKKLYEVGNDFDLKGYCPLNIKVSVTPHGARVSVVSQYITFLPADLIGLYITGQKPGVVPYYVRLDSKAIEAEQVQQAQKLRYAAVRNRFEPVLTGKRDSSAFIHADAVNSNLAQGMKLDLDETITSHGCVSISFIEGARTGLDVLRETRGAEAVANKTEICPYGNLCPPEVINALRGTHRCGLCDRAVRSVDHLPAVTAKIRQVSEEVEELFAILQANEQARNGKYTQQELDLIDDERARLCEDLAGWLLNAQILESIRQRILRGEESRKWVVPKPEIIERDLTRVAEPLTMTAYVLSRLGECIAYPTLESPQIRANFELLRREILARTGSFEAAFAREFPVDQTAACAGLLKSLLESIGMDVVQLCEYLEDDGHLQKLPRMTMRLLGDEEGMDVETE